MCTTAKVIPVFFIQTQNLLFSAAFYDYDFSSVSCTLLKYVILLYGASELRVGVREHQSKFRRHDEEEMPGRISIITVQHTSLNYLSRR